jgi:PAS domain S-box-containing protein
MRPLIASAASFIKSAAAGASSFLSGATARPQEDEQVLRGLTRRESEEQETFDAKRLLRAVEQIAHVGNWRLDLKTGHVICSDEVYRIHGGEPSGDTLSLETALAAYHSDDQAIIRALMHEAAANGTEFEHRLRLLRQDGEVRHVLVRGLCERTTRGAVSGLFGVIMDVTKVVLAEAATAESNRHLRLAGQVARMGYWRTDLATGNVVWSDDLYPLYGLTPGEPVTMDAVLEAYHPDDRPRPGTFDLANVRPGASFEAHRRILHPDGEVRHVLVRAVCEAGEDASCVSLFGVTMDVTALRRAEITAQESEARYRLIAENATDLFCRFAPDSTVLWVSPAIETILGFKPEEIVGRKVLDQMHEEDQPHIIEAFRRMVAGGPDGEPTTWRYRSLHRDGRWIWLEGRPRATFDAAGRVVHLQDVIRDITAAKQAEETLEAAQLAAESAAAAKSEFLATMSHELRTPLTSILGFAGLLQARGQMGETEMRFVRRINDASRMLLTVVNDVLEFSKLEAGRTELENRPFGLRELVDDTVALVAGQAAEKGLSISITVDRQAPDRLSGDAGRLRQVLLNLLNNAVKFTATGSIAVEVTLDLCANDAARLTFSVTDTGPGVPADRMDRLFQRFSQADGSMSRRYGGTGLGLAICRGLIELMEGQIGVDSSEGQGSRFWFTISLPALEQVGVLPPEAAVAPATMRAGRILVAEDSEANRELIRLMVTALGHDVALVHDGAAAVGAVETGHYDMVLMDVHMPVLSGLLATRRIRAMGGDRGGLPIVALTADVLPEQIVKCREAGMDDHLAKPIAPAALAAVLARWLASRDGLHDTTPAALSA